MSASEFGLTEEILSVLKPFEEISKLASSDTKKINYIISAVATLQSYLSKKRNDSGILTMKEELGIVKKSLEGRFLTNSINLFQIMNVILSILIHPRLKAKFLKDEISIKIYYVMKSNNV